MINRLSGRPWRSQMACSFVFMPPLVRPLSGHCCAMPCRARDQASTARQSKRSFDERGSSQSSLPCDRRPARPSFERRCHSRSSASTGCKAFTGLTPPRWGDGPASLCGPYSAGASRQRNPLRLMKVRRENDSLDRFLILLTPAQNAPVIDARLAGGPGKEGFKTRHLRVAQPEKIRHVHRSFSSSESHGESSHGKSEINAS